MDYEEEDNSNGVKILDKDAVMGFTYLNDIIDKKFIDMEELSERDYITILLDLMLYKDEDLVKNAFALLHLHFSQKSNLISQLKEIQLIEDVAMQKDQKRIKSIKNHLSNLAESIENWFQECHLMKTDAEKDAKDTIRLLEELCDFCTIK